MNKKIISFTLLLVCLSLFVSAIVFANSDRDHNSFTTVSQTNPIINAPYFENNVLLDQAAVTWFGQVDDIKNHANIRIGYNDEELVFAVHIFDQNVWYDPTPSGNQLDDWDAITFYVQTNNSSALTTQAYQFTAQVNHWESRDNFQTAFKWNGSNWASLSAPFTTTTAWRGSSLNETNNNDRGWLAKFQIPFSTLGVSKPADNSAWKLGWIVHDRDSSGGPVLQTSWPESFSNDQTSSWGGINFGMPDFQPEDAAPAGTTKIRHGLNGAQVEDAHVGGGTICGSESDPNFFTSWGSINRAGDSQVNIQNQWDVADWPCFSRYYVTFPLDSIPTDKNVVSATLTLHQFGNSGPNDAVPSFIQVMTVGESWDEQTIIWNNAPLPSENLGGTWVDVLYSFPGWPGVPITWNVSRAAAEAYEAGTPLRLVLYSADGEYHSGKYFSSSEAGDWNAVARPTLDVTWGNPAFDVSVSPSVQTAGSGETVDFSIDIDHGSGFNENVSISFVDNYSDLNMSLNSNVVASPGGRVTLSVTDVLGNSNGRFYTIPIQATSNSITKNTTVHLFINGDQVFLPSISN
jgi:hypothetical protein